MDNNRLSTLNIIELNVRSLITHHRRHDMLSFLQRHRPDAILLCETHLRPKHTLHFRDYDLIRNDIGDSAKTGTGIIIKSTFKHKKLPTTSWNLKSLESTAIQISTNASPITLVSIYRHHSHTSPDDLCEDLDKIIANISPSGPFVIGGDFNAHHTSWNNSHNCRFGTRLYDWYQNNRILNISLKKTHDPTYYSSHTNSIIDFFFISNILIDASNPAHTDDLPTLDYPSDHRAVHLTIDTNYQFISKTPMTYLDYNNTNWRSFRETIESGCDLINISPTRNMSPNEIDTAVADLTNLITNTIEELVPVKSTKSNTLLKISHCLLHIIQYKKTLRRRWQRHHYDPNDHQLISQIKCVDIIIQDRLRIAYNEHWIKTLESIEINHNVFKNINKYTARKKRHTIPNLIQNGNIIEDDSQKSELFGSVFHNIHQQNLLLGDMNFTQTTNNYIHTEFNNTIPKNTFTHTSPADPSNTFNTNIHLTSINNLKSIIKSRNNKKSCGADNIPNYIIRKLGNRFIITLATILNQAFNIHYFPTYWKTALIITIHKNGKPNNQPESYRPISLLPCLSKIYERAIKDKLDEQCELLNLLPQDQFGFIRHRSTTHPLVILQSDIITALHHKKPTIAIALDIAKAFDTAWIEGIIHKFSHIYNIDHHLCRLLYSYLTDRKFNVRINDTLSNTYPINAGVPQGGVLSALIYILYIADMPPPLTNINQIKRLQYADDTLIYLSVKNVILGATRLNDYIQAILDYQSKWKIQCSPDKCELIVFRGPTKLHTKSIIQNCSKIHIHINNKILTPQPTLKYLGIIFSQDTKHIKHIDNLICKATSATHAIRSIVYGTQGASPAVRTLCYKTLIRPIITYGCPCWSAISSHQMERLRVLERKCLRHCTKTKRSRDRHKYLPTSELYKKASLKPIDVHISNQTCRFFNKIDTNELPIMAEYRPHSPPPDNPTLHRRFILPSKAWEFTNRIELPANSSANFYHRRHLQNGRTDPVYIRK